MYSIQSNKTRKEEEKKTQTNTKKHKKFNGVGYERLIPGAARAGPEARPAAAIVNSPVCVLSNGLTWDRLGASRTIRAAL